MITKDREPAIEAAEGVQGRIQDAPIDEKSPEESNLAPIESMEPTLLQERIIEIDILRGVAILGMILWDFRSPTYGNYGSKVGIDYVVCGILSTLDLDNTVYRLFTFLFGLGMAMQMIRSHSDGLPFTPIYLRRLLGLFMIGLFTYLFLDQSDVLHVYALFAVFLLFFRSRSDRTLLVVAMILIAGPVLGRVILSKFMSAELYYSRAWGNYLNPQLLISLNYVDIVIARAKGFVEEYTHLHVYIKNLDILGLFLLGFYAGRKGILQNISVNKNFIRSVSWCSLAVGLLGLGWDSGLRQLELIAKAGPGLLLPVFRFLSKGSVQALAKLYFSQALSLFYACVIVLLLHGNSWKRYFQPLACVGRLPLSNYLLHSLIGPVIFYGYGFALYGKLGCAFGEGLAITVFGLQMYFSSWWLRKYRLGPTEWLWRCLTYMKFQSMKARAH